jgi:hypothetical protein
MQNAEGRRQGDALGRLARIPIHCDLRHSLRFVPFKHLQRPLILLDANRAFSGGIPFATVAHARPKPQGFFVVLVPSRPVF